MSEQTTFSIPEFPLKRPSLIGEELEGMDETIYVDAETGGHISLNTIGSAILELCDGSHSVEQIVDIISESVEGGDKERIRKDTHNLLMEFAAYGIFTE